MQRVAIIGGGVSGISAAYYLEEARRAGASVAWCLYESERRLGGVLQTSHLEGFTVEGGPDSFLTAKPAAAELAREIGLADQLIPSNETDLRAGRKTYILTRGKLVPMPDGLQMMVPTNLWATATTPLFSWRTKLKMLREYCSPPRALAPDDDESVASFVERHFGVEVVERLAAPLLAGVYGGDAAQLSARSVLPNLIATETKHGSLVRGALSAMRSRGAHAAQPLFTSFRGGMQQFTDAIVDRLPVSSILSRNPVLAMRHEAEGWRVIGSDGRQEVYSSVIMAVPAYVAASLLQPTDAQLAARLSEIGYASSVTVSLAFAKSLELPKGFGFLVPRTEGRRMMACTFSHQKFAHRAPSGASLLRVFVAGAPEEDDATLTEILRNELAEILGVRELPLFTSVFRWNEAMAQYSVGHGARVQEIEARAAQGPGLHLIGNAYRGIGIPDCVQSAKNAAARITSK